MMEAAKTTKGKLLMMAIVLAMVLVALAATSKPAAAYTHSRSGNPGGVDAYKAQGSHLAIYCGIAGYSCYTPWVIAQGPVVYRSSSSTGTQTITVLYTFERWNGSGWVRTAQKTATRYLYAGYSRVQMPRGDYTPNGNGYFRVHTTIAWANSNDTVVFGMRNLQYDQVGDYSCNTNLTSKCNASNGWVYLQGAP